MEWGNIAQFGSLIVALVTLIYVVISNRSKASADQVQHILEKVDGKASGARVETLEKDHRTHQDRIVAIEAKLNDLPKRSDFNRLEISQARLEAHIAGELKALSAQLKPVTAIVQRMQELSLEEAREARAHKESA